MAEEKPVAMTTPPNPLDDSTPLRVRRGRVASVDLYEIKDTELDTLEKGTPADLQLNFAIFLLSIAFSALAALATTMFTNKTIETTYIIVAVVGILLGAYLMITWWRTRSEVKELCKLIRQRIPPDTSVPLEEEAEEPDSAAGITDAEPTPKG